jgi:hypothetical protein
MNALVDPHSDPKDLDWTYILWSVMGDVLGAFVLHGLGYHVPIEVCMVALFKLLSVAVTSHLPCVHLCWHYLARAYAYTCPTRMLVQPCVALLSSLQDGTIVAVRSADVLHGSTVEGIGPGGIRFGNAFVMRKPLLTVAKNIGLDASHPERVEGALPWSAMVADKYTAVPSTPNGD